MDRVNSCCFTGHRPQKLPWGFDEADPRCAALMEKLYKAIRFVVHKGKTRFYTGMAMGTDIWCAQIVLQLKKELPDKGIELIAVIPHKGQGARYPDEWKARYYGVLNAADERMVLQDHYTQGCMQRRNRFMVDNSSMLIAVYSGDAGGTKDTFDYAVSKGLSIIWIEPASGRIKTNFQFKD